MSQRNIEIILKEFNNNILPAEFNFNTEVQPELDWSKVKYNTFYKTNEYYESILPSQLKKMPGYDLMLEYLVNNSLTPLEEINNRINESSNK